MDDAARGDGEEQGPAGGHVPGTGGAPEPGPGAGPPTAPYPSAGPPPIPAYAAPGGYAPPPTYGAPPYGPTGAYAAPNPYAQPSYPPPSPPAGNWLPPGADPHLGPYAAGGPTSAPYIPPYASGLYQSEPQGWQTPQMPPGTVVVRSQEDRSRSARRGLLIALVVVVVIGVGFAIGALLAPASPKTAAVGLVKSSTAAAEQAGTFHYVEISTNDGSINRIRGDAAPDSGRQTITARGKAGLDVFDLRLVSGVVYFRGNRAAVIDQLGVPTGKAAAVVDRWVAIHKGQGAYKTFAAGITTSSNISQLTDTFVPTSSQDITGSSPPATRVLGALFAGKGKPSVGAAALVVTKSSSLPQSMTGAAVGTDGTRLSLTWTFSRWHQKVMVAAPAGALPYSSIGATTPTK